jgi:hypothetical protein
MAGEIMTTGPLKADGAFSPIDLTGVPRATPETDGLMTVAQVGTLAAAQTAQQVGSAIGTALNDYSTTTAMGTAIGNAVAGLATESYADTAASNAANAVRAGAARCYATKAALRADTSGYALNTRVMFDGDPAVYLWASGSTYADDTSETSPAVQVGALAGRFVREGYVEVTSVAAGAGETTIWSYPIPASSVVKAYLEGDCYASTGAGLAQKHWTGPLVAIARRDGTAAAALDCSGAGTPWKLDDSDWDPHFELSGNNLVASIVGDDSAEIVVKFSVETEIVETTGAPDPVVDPIAVAWSVLLADGFGQLYRADMGTAPESPTAGDSVAAWADQSGGERHLSAGAGDEPVWRVDGSDNGRLEIAPTVVVKMSVAGATCCAGDHTIVWTEDSTASGTFGVLFQRSGETIAVHTGAGFNSSGSNVMITLGGTWTPIGVMQDGLHTYALAVDYAPDGLSASCVLTVDGTAQAPVTVPATVYPSGPTSIGYDGASYAGNTDWLYGWGVVDEVANGPAAHFRTFANLKWGAP